MPTDSTVQDSRNWQSFSVSDFTGGLVSRGFSGTAGPQLATFTSKGGVGSVPPPPRDSASLNQPYEFVPTQNQALGNPLWTYRCIALPTGGLAPLPAGIADLTPTANANHSHGTVFFNGFFCNSIAVPNAESVGNDYSIVGELIISSEGCSASPSGTKCLLIESWQALAQNTILSIAGLGSAELDGAWHQINIFATRMADVSSVPTNWETAGKPVVVIGWAPTNQTGHAHIYLYPDPTNATAFGTLDIAPASQDSFFTFGHQGRVVGLSKKGDHWPGVNATIGNNERICYTDPPNSYDAASTTFGLQNEIFVPEAPWGYGCWGSLNASELLLIKLRGGGVVVQGDLFNPSVVFVPGVQDTSGWPGNAAVTPEGLVYCSGSGGAWIWTGGASSEKISNQLSDYFFQYSNPDAPDVGDLHWTVCAWKDYYCFPNNYLYAKTLKSWWLLDSNSNSNVLPGNPNLVAGQTQFWYAPDPTGYNLFALPLYYLIGDDVPPVIRYNYTTGASDYQYRSHPMMIANRRTVNIREILVHTIGQAGSTVGVYIPGVNNTSFQDSFTIPTPATDGAPDSLAYLTPYVARLSCNIEVTELELGLWANGNEGFAPLISDVTLYYTESREIAQV